MTRISVGLNLIDCLWSVLALCFLVAFCAHKTSAYLPKLRETSGLFTFFQDLIRYGKTKQNLNRCEWLRVFDVPKRWFWHFYFVSVCWNVFLLVLLLNSTYQQQPYPSWLTWILEILTGVPSNASKGPQLSTVLVQLLFCVHSLRRLLECLFVSVFSDGVLHLVQYVFGLGYYIVLGLTVLCSDHTAKGTGTLLSQLDWIHVAGILLFVGASLLQHHSMVLLARLRTGKSGRVETLAHRMPKGSCFKLVSCPHYFAELLIYISFSLVFGGLSLTWWLVVLYVLFNQALAGQLSHELYISKYNSYPKHRRAFIPFLL
ncbi:polyprenol reductase [Kryptolebias marmoratus]|uniref:polyprenol reductase n=1 Tax=Kryptolebias marmoratus TaxID=37003 RepID=UPI0007F90E33|nr:polyprenol reductase [Kryptolebias marmoratus]